MARAKKDTRADDREGDRAVAVKEEEEEDDEGMDVVLVMVGGGFSVVGFNGWEKVLERMVKRRRRMSGRWVVYFMVLFGRVWDSK